MSVPISEDYVPCRTLPGDERRWYAFLIVSVVTPFILAIPVILLRIFRWAQNRARRGHKISKLDDIGFETVVSFATARLTSDLGVSGQILRIIGVLCAAGSLVIYWSDSALPCQDVEVCQRWTNNVWWQIDLAFNCYFLVYYILRFLAAHDRLMFIFGPMQLADYFTVPVVFVSIGLSRNWHGLRFLRILNTLWIVDLLHRWKILSSAAQVQLARLVCYVTMAVIIGAGSFLLLECQGDPWDTYGNRQTGDSSTFWNYAYFSVVTISTVGYGDIGCKTLLGRFFTCLYIFACLFFIASFIATAATLIPSPRRYPKFDHHQYFDHVVVCGYITSDTLERFLKEFYGCVRRKGIEIPYVIVLHPDEPEDEMLLLLNDYQSHVEYMKGSTLQESDLAKARLAAASSCVILTNHNTTEDDSDDILRIVAIKRSNPKVRVVIQTVREATAGFLKRYPAIDAHKGDVVTCKRNIIAGLAGASCMIPGFSTLVADLLSNEFVEDFDATVVPSLYVRGQRMTLTCINFSPAFYGLTFPEAVEICFVKLEIVLLAVYNNVDDSTAERGLIPNPTSSCIIQPGMVGQVITPSDHHAKICEYFCKTCHADSTMSMIGPCECKKTNSVSNNNAGNGFIGTKNHSFPALVQNLTNSKSSEVPSLSHTDHAPVDLDARLDDLSAVALSGEDAGISHGANQLSFDSTGMFHWSRKAPEGAMTPAQAADRHFDDHIIIFVSETCSVSSIGLLKLVIPLRSSTIPVEKLRDIVIVGLIEEMQHEYDSVSNLPRVYAITGNLRQMSVIRSCRPENSFACVVLSGNNQQADKIRADRAVIVLTLQLQAMNFTEEQAYGSNRTPRHASGKDLQIISVLEHESSVRFLAPSGNNEFRTTVPHMSGLVLTAAQMDSLSIPAFFNPSLVKLFVCLVFGGISTDLDRILADGNHLLPAKARPTKVRGRQLITSMDLFSMDSGEFSQFVGRPYLELFRFALRTSGLLCLGIYRLFTLGGISDFKVEEWGSDRRFVATNPPPDMILDASDLVYVLLPAIIL